eukprot:515144-Karenia_brevis.AAC.1
MAHPGPASATVAWIIERDRATRLKARSLHQSKWPWGEAVESAYTKHVAVLWTSGNTTPVGRPLPVLEIPDEDHQSRDNHSTPRSGKGGRDNHRAQRGHS